MSIKTAVLISLSTAGLYLTIGGGQGVDDAIEEAQESEEGVPEPPPQALWDEAVKNARQAKSVQFTNLSGGAFSMKSGALDGSNWKSKNISTLKKVTCSEAGGSLDLCTEVNYNTDCQVVNDATASFTEKGDTRGALDARLAGLEFDWESAEEIIVGPSDTSASDRRRAPLHYQQWLVLRPYPHPTRIREARRFKYCATKLNT